MNEFNLKDNKVIIVIICIIIIIFLCVFFYTRSNLENEYTELDQSYYEQPADAYYCGCCFNSACNNALYTLWTQTLYVDSRNTLLYGCSCCQHGSLSVRKSQPVPLFQILKRLWTIRKSQVNIYAFCW